MKLYLFTFLFLLMFISLSSSQNNFEGKGHYVHIGDTVSVVMNTIKEELSFGLNGVIFGVAFKGISLC